MDNVWEKALPFLQDTIKGAAFERWVRPIRFGKLDGERLHLEVPTNFFREYLQQEFLPEFERVFRDSLGSVYQIVLEVSEFSSPIVPMAVERKPAPAQELEPTTVRGTRLNPKYTFETFVVGKSNQFAYAAARAVAERPSGNNYNPLFIFGGVGLGKTHLVNAIGTSILKKTPRTRIIYVSSENFTNEVVSSIQHNKMEDFKRKYRSECDLLLIDDIQFIAGKQSTQEEFFHTFEELRNQGRQIVVTSDKPAREIQGLEERLMSRLDWGLTVDIQAPDLETKIAILKRKAELDHFPLTDEVAQFLATHCSGNMRELEGSLTRVKAHADLGRGPATLEAIRELFQHTIEEKSRKPTIDMIQQVVAEKFDVKVTDLRSPRKHKVIALPRQIAMYLSRTLTGASFPEIGDKFGGKDHATVIHACRKIEGLLQEDTQLRYRVHTIQKALGVVTA